jgi:hypothetical protein
MAELKLKLPWLLDEGDLFKVKALSPKKRIPDSPQAYYEGDRPVSIPVTPRSTKTPSNLPHQGVVIRQRDTFRWVGPHTVVVPTLT